MPKPYCHLHRRHCHRRRWARRVAEHFDRQTTLAVQTPPLPAEQAADVMKFEGGRELARKMAELLDQPGCMSDSVYVQVPRNPPANRSSGRRGRLGGFVRVRAPDGRRRSASRGGIVGLCLRAGVHRWSS